MATDRQQSSVKKSRHTQADTTHEWRPCESESVGLLDAIRWRPTRGRPIDGTPTNEERTNWSTQTGIVATVELMLPTPSAESSRFSAERMSRVDTEIVSIVDYLIPIEARGDP